jgi:tryptophan halogenase
VSTAPINDVVVVGRDAPLWLAACVVQSALAPAGVRVTAVELPSLLQAANVYATLPALEALHNRLRIDEATLLGETGGSFSLGQNFVDASSAAPAFFHAYGSYGAPIDNKAFFPFWIKACGFGLQVFSLTAAAAKYGRMLIPDPATETYGRTDYGYHVPAVDYVRSMKKLAMRRGVVLHEAGAVDAVLDPDEGAIVALDIGDGQRVEGQFFVDATGAEAQLIGSALGVPREGWREYFPADRSLVASAARFASIPPYAEIRAWTDGWLGLYPSQARTHIAQVYSSALRSDDEALQVAAKVSGLSLHDAAFKVSDPGRRAVAWQRNCVAVGEAACVFDPIDSVDLQAVQIGLVHLLSLFPVQSDYAAERIEYNRSLRMAFERIRHFQSAHYAINRYAHSSFWTHARQAPELTHKIETFRARGDVPLYENETFPLDSWQAMFVGHGMVPETYDPIIDRTPPEMVKRELRRILGFIKDKVQEQTSHDFYLQSVCSGREGASQRVQ